MKITIKVLNGQDCTLEVDAGKTILELKQEIELLLNIPASNQKLLLVGRTLTDENTIASYPTIKDGTKIMLVVMRMETPKLRDVINKSFRKYFNEQQSEKMTKEFMADFEMKLKQLSLDDIERLSENILMI